MTDSKIRERLQTVDIAPKTFTYKPVATNEDEEALKKMYPTVFEAFEAISIGDDDGTVCLVPLDECDRETAEMIVELLNDD